jgi:hypothetical protein
LDSRLVALHCQHATHPTKLLLLLPPLLLLLT